MVEWLLESLKRWTFLLVANGLIDGEWLDRWPDI